MRGQFRKISCLLLAGALVASACGSDDDNTATGSTEPVTEGSDDGTSATTAVDDTVSEGEPATETTSAAGEEPGEEPLGDVCTADKAGGEITIAPRGVGATLDTYNANLGGVQTGFEGYLLYSTLVRYDSDSASYVPYIAESLEGNDDSTVWTLTLRPEVRFGNGDALDADALIAHIDRQLAEESTSRPKRYAAPFIESYSKVDDWSVDFTTTSPFGDFPSIFAGQLGMVQNIAVVNELGQEAFAQDPQGGGVGPYEVAEWAPPERVVFTAKDDWWGGPVCIQQVTLTFIPDLAAAYDAYETGEVDLVYFNRDPVALASARDEHPEATYSVGVFNGAFMVMPNIAAGNYDGPMSDVRVRQAMAYAIDPEVINQRAWGGQGWPDKGLANAVSNELTPTDGIPYDPDRARELLDEYKAETGWDGTVNAVAAGTPASNREAAITVAAMLDAVGFNVQQDFDLSLVPFITQVITDKNYEIVASWGFIYPESNLYSGLRQWASPEKGGFYNGYASEGFDAALDQMREAGTIEEYQASIEAIQSVINEEVPFQIYGADVGTTMARETIHGIVWDRGIEPLLESAYLE